MTSNETDCDSCGQVSDYPMAELRAQGWIWHDTEKYGRKFIMCPECEEEYARRRELKAKLAKVA